jgi:hypothetical protein
MNTLKFLKGQKCYVQVGMRPQDRIFFRITERNGSRIRLKELQSVEVDGKWVPGDLKDDGMILSRKVKEVEGREYGAPYNIGGMAGWIRLYRKAKGGKRINAGRPKGPTGKKVQISKTICMTKDDWELLDKLRGKKSRGKFFRNLLADSGIRKS